MSHLRELSWADTRDRVSMALAGLTVIPRWSPPHLVRLWCVRQRTTPLVCLQIHSRLVAAPPETDVRRPERQTAQSRLQDLEQSIGIGSVGVHDGFAASELVSVDLPDACPRGRCLHHLLSFKDSLALVDIAESVTAEPEVGDDRVLLVPAVRGNGCVHAGQTLIGV